MDPEQEPLDVKNTVTIEQAGPCRKKVVVEIPEQAIKDATDRQYETLRKEAMVPGFRPGRAPRRLLEKRFGKEVAEQVKLKLLADAGDSAVKDSQLSVLREPDIDFEKVVLPESGALKFEFEVEVRPEFDLPVLEGIPVEKRKLQVTDDQITREIEQLQRWSGMWVPRQDGSVELDDQVIADVILKVEDVQEHEKLDNIEVFVRPKGFVAAVPVEDLDKLLVGAKPGDSRQSTVEVPGTYFKKEYRGKKVDIDIHVKDVKWLKPAPLDENFFKRFGVDSENQMRENLRDNLQNRLEQQVRTEMTEQIYRYMLDNTDFELPTDIVADQATTVLQRNYSNLLKRGLGPEEIDRQIQQIQAASEQQAKQQLKTFFIMDKVAEKLGIEVTDEEINGQIAALAIQRHQRPERLKEQLTRDGSLAQFKLQVCEDKCVARLLESARIEDVEGEKKPARGKKAAAAASKKTDVKAASTAAAKKKTAKKGKTSAKNKTDK